LPRSERQPRRLRQACLRLTRRSCRSCPSSGSTRRCRFADRRHEACGTPWPTATPRSQKMIRSQRADPRSAAGLQAISAGSAAQNACRSRHRSARAWPGGRFRPEAVVRFCSQQRRPMPHSPPSMFGLDRRGRMETGYSMTSSARPRIDCGNVRPSAFAVFKLTISSNFVGCWTGRSAGFAPFRILST